MILELHDLVCGYRPGKPVIGPLSFSVSEGEVVCLLGPNGIGKTTLFKTVLGLLAPLSGKISVCGHDSLEFSIKEFARAVAYVPQSHTPPFPYTVRDIVVMGRNPNMAEFASPKKADFDKADEMLALMGIGDLAGREYTEISGGEQQLALIARALAQETRLLVMDEPTSHLDYGNEMRVLSQATQLSRLGYTIIMITHTPGHAFLCADRVVAVGRGGFFACGTPDEVMTEENLKTIYGVDIQLAEVVLKESGRRVKICVPAAIV